MKKIWKISENCCFNRTNTVKPELSRSIAGNEGELPIETYTYRRGTCALSKIAASADKHVLF